MKKLIIKNEFARPLPVHIEAEGPEDLSRRERKVETLVITIGDPDGVFLNQGDELHYDHRETIKLELTRLKSKMVSE